MTSLAGVHSDADAKIGSHHDESTGPSVHSDKEKNFEPGHATSALTKAAQEEHALTPLRAIKTYWKAFFWCMFICIGGLLWGYDAQIGGGTLSIPTFRRDFGYIYQGEYVLPAKWQSAFNSVSSIGGIFGGLSLGYIADKFGRRGAIAFACVISTAAVFIQFFTKPHVYAQLLVGKLFNGYALGMYVSGAANYCSEVSPLALRGITTGSVNLWIVLGQFLSNVVIEITGNRLDAYAYRIPYAIQWIFPVILMCGLPFAPESPWWLVRRGRIEDARSVIVRLSGSTIDADLHVQQIKETIELEERHAANTSYLDTVRGANRRRTNIALMVFVLQQVAGVVFVLGFSSYFFQLAGFDTSNSFRLGVGVTGIGIIGNLVALFTVNAFGRRALFFWGMIGCAVVNFLVGFSSLAGNQAGNWSSAAFTIIYNFVYQVGIGPLGYVIFAEVGSAKLRSKTVGIGICVNSMCGMIANIVIPYLVNPDEANLQGKVGFIFGGLGLIGSAWTWFYIPETKNRTIDELDLLFEARVPPRQFQKTDVGTLSG